MNKPGALKKINGRLGTILFGLVILTAVFLRFYQLDSLPPAIHPNEAGWLVLSRQLLTSPYEFFTSISGATVGFIFHIGIGSAALGMADSVLSVRYVNAALGVLTVVGLYFWTKSLFGRRTALVAAFLIAVSPWAITLSRNNVPANTAMLVFVCLCFFATKAYRTGRLPYVVSSIALLLVGCFSSRTFWIVPVIFGVLTGIAFVKNRKSPIARKMLVATIVSAVLVSLAFLVLLIIGGKNPATGLNSATLGQLSGNGVLEKAKLLVENGANTVGMFFLRGDEDYSTNLGGLPMLNVFVGIMFILGLLVSFVRRQRLAYTFLLTSLVLLLVPGLFASAAPDAYRTSLALPVIMLASGVGVNYLLARWYQMFPVNTTARTLGLSFVVFLLILTGYQGYRQYFVAWAQDPNTYLEYREDLRAIAEYNFGANTYVVVSDADTATLAAYAQAKAKGSDFIDQRGSIGELESQPLKDKPRLIVVVQDERTEGVKQRIEAKYPGSKYLTKTSDFDERILFGWYVVK